jgi:hypothetical protein
MNLVSVPEAAQNRGIHTADSAASPLSIALRACCALGRAGVLLLVAMLPFEVTQRPLLHFHATTVSNLELVFYVVAVVAAATVVLAVADSRSAGFELQSTGLRLRPAPLIILAALIAVSLISSLLGAHRAVGIKWSLHIVAAGAIWVAVPLWLEGETRSRPRFLRALGLALVAGAAVSALLGVIEVATLRPPKSSTATFLAAFKSQLTLSGIYVRLSGTFEYANIASDYFAMVIPFALVGLVREAARGHRTSQLKLTTWAATLALLLIATLLTYSRGGAVAAVAGIVAVFVFMGARRVEAALRLRRTWILGGTVLLVVIGGFLALASPGSVLLRLRTQSDLDWYRATFAPVGGHSLPRTMATGHLEQVPIVATNTGALAWRAQGIDPYRISYHWLLPSGRVIVFDGARTVLPRDVAPGGTIQLVAAVLAPDRPGRYLLAWDVVQENVLWFSIHSGTYSTVPVRVIGKPIAGVVEGARYRHPNALPQTPPAPDRTQLWTVAWRMIKARPLVGVGPDGYRLDYGRYTTPPLRTWDTRIYANSLPLELAADLGVIGAGLFFGFLLLNVWPLMRVAWGSASWAVAVVASIVAFSTHGLIDYLLGNHAVFILLWLLLALTGASFVTTSHAPRDAGAI